MVRVILAIMLLLASAGSAFAEAGRSPDITTTADSRMDWDTAYAAQTRGDLDQAILFYDRAIRAGGLSNWRAAALLTDRGIAARVPQRDWQAAVDALIAHNRSGDVASGFVAAIEACGKELAAHFPRTEAATGHELPDRIYVI